MTEKETGSGQADDLRQRAEEIARVKAVQAPETLDALSPEETQRMLHELRVHQIELEMQNEELRRTQGELETARARYFDLYDLAPLGYFTLNEKGIILETNLTAAALMGVARGALVQQPWSRFILPEDQDLSYLLRKQLFETGEPQACELRMLKKDGAPFWARVEAVAAQDANGAPVCHAMVSDITERKEAEEVLKKSIQLLSDIGKMAKVGGWELDLSTKEVSWTEEVGRIHGVEPGYRLKLEEALNFYAPESRPALEEALKKAAETGEPYDLESLFIPSGSKDRIWVGSLGRAVYRDGKITKLAGTFQNIDKYKQAEEALRASEAKYRLLVENAAEAIVVAQEGMLTFVNRMAGELTGYSEQELTSRPFLEFVHGRPEHGDGTPSEAIEGRCVSTEIRLSIGHSRWQYQVGGDRCHPDRLGEQAGDVELLHRYHRPQTGRGSANRE